MPVKRTTSYLLVPLTRGMFAKIDPADAILISGYSWNAIESKGVWTAMSRVGGVKQYMHRILMNAPKGVCVDHINGDTLDNRRCNLRLATSQQNSFNRKVPAHSRTGFKGVKRSRKRFNAYIGWNGVTYHLGVFDTPELAAVAYDEAARKIYGEFARVNFPIESVDRNQTSCLSTMAGLSDDDHAE